MVDGAGAVLASATVDHVPFASEQSGWADQDPRDWWRASQEAIRQVLSQGAVQPKDITSVGLSGQMHGAVLLDQAHEVVRPALIWCDQRTEEQCRWLDSVVGAERLLRLTCNPALTNFTLTKLLWVRQHEPRLWERVRHVLLPKDYVRLRLSGELAIDVADASGTLILDVAGRKWSNEILSATGLDAAILPTVYESPEVCARVSAEAAQLTGIPAGTPIVAGAGDQAAGAVGMGITRPGMVSVTIGTSGVVFAATEHPSLDPKGRLHTFCHAIPGRWHVMGVTQAAGLSFRWFRDMLSSDAEQSVDYERLTKEASQTPPGADGLLWGPYLMGERTPHLDPRVRAGLVGIGAHHTRGHVTRAILEGVAFSQRDSFTIFRELGVPIERVRIGGGGARSPLWRQIQADVYGLAVETLEAEEGAAYGAALLAGVGAGIWSNVDEACDQAVRGKETIQPQSAVASAMNERYEAYRKLYGALKDFGHEPVS